jgi:hypothetical protein
MVPELSVDPSNLRTERVELDGEQHARVDVVMADARLELKVLAGGTLALLAYVKDGGPAEAHCALKIDGNFVTFTMTRGMSGREVMAAVQGCLPPGYQATTRESSQAGVLIVSVLRPEPAPPEPEISFLSTDPDQLFRWAGKNKVRIEGSTSKAFSVRSVLDLSVDGYRVKLPLQRGEEPLSTANRIRDALPKLFSALIELPVSPGGEVTLTVLRRR